MYPDMARHLSVALLGSKSLGSQLGKKGTSSDITLYNSPGEDGNVTYVEPTNYPDKFPPLLNAMYMGDQVLLAVEAVDRNLAEMVVSLDVAHRTDGLVALSENVGKEEFLKAFKGTIVEKLPIVPLDPRTLKQQLLTRPETSPEDGALMVPIDHAFPVKGVGTVILGVVKRGTTHIHEKLRLYPEDKIVEVRSIQVHDVDQSEAGPGTRVGLALKGIEAEEVSRGQVLAPVDSLQVRDLLELHDYSECRFFKGRAGEGDKVHVSVGLQVLPAKVERVDGNTRTLQLDAPAAWTSGQRAYLLQLSGAVGGPRIAGGGTLS